LTLTLRTWKDLPQSWVILCYWVGSGDVFMATQRSATVRITNNSGGNARILLFHNNSSNGTQSGNWTAAPGETAGPLTVYFETGWGS
jgi:hypothetical protein